MKAEGHTSCSRLYIRITMSKFPKGPHCRRTSYRRYETEHKKRYQTHPPSGAGERPNESASGLPPFIRWYLSLNLLSLLSDYLIDRTSSWWSTIPVETGWTLSLIGGLIETCQSILTGRNESTAQRLADRCQYPSQARVGGTADPVSFRLCVV